MHQVAPEKNVDMYNGGGSGIFNPRPRKAKCKNKESLVDFSEAATTHGIYYVFERNSRPESKFFWVLVCIALVVLALNFIKLMYDDWRLEPILTTVSKTGYSVSNLEFPAITICGLGMIDEVIEQAYVNQITNYLTAKGTWVDPNVTDPVTLLNWYGSSFLDDKYPGATISPRDMAAALTSQNPDEFVSSEVAVEGGYDPCDHAAHSNTTSWSSSQPKCDAGLEYDDDYDICYYFKPWNSTLNDVDTICNGIYGSMVDIFSNWQLKGIIQMVEAGKFPKIKTGASTLWTSIKRSFDGNFGLSDGYPLKDANFSNLLLSDADLNDFSKECMFMVYDKDVKKFRGKQEDCEAKVHSPLCQVPPTWSFSCAQTRRRRNAIGNTKLDDMLNPAKKVELSKNLAQSRKSYRDSFRSVNMSVAYESFFELLWYSQLPCYDVEGVTATQKGERSLLKRCKWKGVNMNCAAIFQTFPTDRGMCCTFNILEADKMFQESEYKKMVLKMQKETRDNAFGNTNLPEWYQEREEPTPHQGVRKGLEVTLDAHTDLIAASSVREDFQGFLAVVSERESYPLTSQKSIRIRAGHVTEVALNAIDIQASDEIEEEDIAHRQCYFPVEKKNVGIDLSINTNYTQANCMIECRIKMAAAKMSVEDRCIPWYLPRSKAYDYPVCDPWGAVEFRTKVEALRTDCDYCLPDCRGTQYSHSVTAVPFRRCDNKNLGISTLCTLNDPDAPNPPIYGEQVLKEYRNDLDGEILPSYIEGKITSNYRRFTPDATQEVFRHSHSTEGGETLEYDAYEKDIAVVNFYFETPAVFQFKRTVRMTDIEFLSQVGGLLGLCVGFSFASAVEIVYWFGCRLWVGCKKTT